MADQGIGNVERKSHEIARYAWRCEECKQSRRFIRPKLVNTDFICVLEYHINSDHVAPLNPVAPYRLRLNRYFQ